MAIGKFFGDIVKGALSSDYQRDYQHASKTFRSGNYGLLPKSKNWWHVYFKLSSVAEYNVEKIRELDIYTGSKSKGYVKEFTFGEEINSANTHLISVLAKSVKLPSYRFDVKRSNQYNKQTLSLNKINYEPVSIEFHDDSLNLIRNLWDMYFTFYIQDAQYRDISGNQASLRHKNWDPEISDFYKAGVLPNWGMDRTFSRTGKGDEFARLVPHFFEHITIYHYTRALDKDSTLNADEKSPRYSAYTLINPMITSFSHDQLDYSSSDGTNNSMTVEYESVSYTQGVISDESIASWSAVKKTHWDNAKSPLDRPIASITGSGGLLNTVGGLLGSDFTSVSGVLGAAVTAGKAVATWKESGGLQGLVNAASGEALKIANQSMAGIRNDITNNSGQTTLVNRANTAVSAVSRAGSTLKTAVTSTLRIPKK